MSQNNPYSKTYNPGWRNYPTFGWGGNQCGGQKPQSQPLAQVQTPPRNQTNENNRLQQPVGKKLSMEEMFMQFMQPQL